MANSGVVPIAQWATQTESDRELAPQRGGGGGWPFAREPLVIFDGSFVSHDTSAKGGLPQSDFFQMGIFGAR